MTPSSPHGKRTLASLVALGVSSLLSVEARSAPAPSPPVTPDLEVVSVATSHTELAPSTSVTLTFVLRATGASTGPFSVGAYYEKGPPVSSGVPKTALLLDTYPVEHGLKKGQLVSFNMPLHLPPCDACGPHTVYVVADVGGAVLEVSRKNNVRTVSLDVAADHLPDLRVSAVSIDKDRGSTSDEIALRGTVLNDSKYFAEGPFRVSVYCSADATLTPKDRRLFSFMVPALGAGQTVGVDRNVQLEPACSVHAATTWLGILVDDQDTVAEANEQNDGKALPYWVFRAPDLTSRPVAVSSTGGPTGSRVLVSYRIGNQGGSAAGPFRTGVYLARPGQMLTQGTLLDAVTLPGLAANTDSGVMQHLVSIPSAPRGHYSLGVWVDVDGANGELHRRNNFRAEPFDVTDVNLTDVYFTAPAKEVPPGSSVLVRLAVHDTGRDPAPASKVGLYYSDDPRFDRGEDTRLGEVDIERLSAGAKSREKSVTVTVPREAREGYHFLLAVVDDGDAVMETDEHDNVALEPLLILAPESAARAER